MDVSYDLSQEEQIKEAFDEGQMDVIDSLLDSGFDVNAPIMGIPPLHRASIGQKPWTLDVVTKLLIHGANVDLECDDGNALNFALSSVPFQPHVAQLLLDCSKKGVNRLDQDGYNYIWTALSIESFKFLVENGIDINHVVDCCGYDMTYLDYSKQEGSSHEFKYLRSVGGKLYSEL